MTGSTTSSFRLGKRVNDREFLGHLTMARDRFVYVMTQGLTPHQVLQLGEVMDSLRRDMLTLYVQPKAEP